MKKMNYQRWGVRARSYNYLAIPFLMMAVPVYAQLDRGGNIIHDDSGGSSSSLGLGFILLAISGVVAWMAYGWLQKKYPENSDATNGNIAIWGALLVVFCTAFLLLER